MNILLYLVPFLTSFFISTVFMILILFVIGKLKKRYQSFPKSSLFRLGGVSVIAAFIISIIVDRNLYVSVELWAIIIVSIYILIVGLIDDFRDICWKYQLFFQILAAAFIFIIGIRIEYVTNPFGGIINFEEFILFSFFFGIFWVVFIINAFNWIDGSDGLSGGIAFIAVITIFFLSLKPEVNQPPVGIITMILAGAILGFLIFNFYPAKIYAGTSGSMFMGFMIAVMAIFAGAKIATTLLIMAVPIIDLVLVIVKRIKSGSSIFLSDKQHLHFQLKNLGWSPVEISLFFYIISTIIAIIALNTRLLSKGLSIIFVFSIITLIILYFNYKSNEIIRIKNEK